MLVVTLGSSVTFPNLQTTNKFGNDFLFPVDVIIKSKCFMQ